MSDAAAAKPSPAKKAAAKKPAKKAEHPPTIVMVKAAIGALKERSGSSTIAIKKYIAANYKGVDAEKIKTHVLKALKKGVADKSLVQIKASYKLAKVEKPKKEVKKKPAAAAAKKPAAKKTAKSPAKKTAAAKKSPAKAKKPAAKKHYGLRSLSYSRSLFNFSPSSLIFV